MSSKVPPIILNNGVEMPQLGFGVWQVPDDEAEQAVGTALEAGYRSIDTAAIYGNEEGTGRAIAASGLPREDIFVTTKLWNSDQGYDSTLRAFDASLEKLGLDHLDLYLIHWPLPSRGTYIDTYKALEKLHADGRVRAIGVSNFLPEHLRRLVSETSVVPAVNQIELHPHLQQHASRELHAEQGIATEAWSPLGQGKGLLEVPAIVAIAQKHDRTPRPGRAALARPARQRRDPEVGHAVPDQGEHRGVRLQPGRRGPRGDQRAQRGPAPGPDPATFDMS